MRGEAEEEEEEEEGGGAGGAATKTKPPQHNVGKKRISEGFDKQICIYKPYLLWSALQIAMFYLQNYRTG